MVKLSIDSEGPGQKNVIQKDNNLNLLAFLEASKQLSKSNTKIKELASRSIAHSLVDESAVKASKKKVHLFGEYSKFIVKSNHKFEIGGS